MDMYDERSDFREDEKVLCGASAYSKLFFMDEDFDSLPEEVKKELKIMCVMHTEEVGGTLFIYFDEDGNLNFRTNASEDDFSFDEIGSALRIKRLQQENREFFEQLENYYRIFFTGDV